MYFQAFVFVGIARYKYDRRHVDRAKIDLLSFLNCLVYVGFQPA
nr:hypothetical protein [Nostoc sp. EfeVER01]